ncbi:MAG: TRAP transporter small permease [Paracoccaceae bacterium]|jgi:TRAP-type C4-dicarboxylate transport system permease small subunit
MHDLMMKLARTMAVMGGVVLSLLILLTCLSILGRSLIGIFHSDWMEQFAPALSDWIINLGVGPINGDFELVEAGVAFAVFAFLPLCQITAGHASVDIVTNHFSKNTNRFLRMVTEILFASILVLIAVRLGAGLLSKFGNGETSFLLEFPVWWAYCLSFVAASVAAVVGCYMACIRVVEFATGRILIWDGVEADT